MKLSPLIQQFSTFLPKHTNKFTDEFLIDTMSAVGSVVTVTTTTDYSFTSPFIFITEALEAVPIIAFTYENETGIVTATTGIDHGLTEAMNIKTVEKSPLTVDLVNNTNTLLNDTFTLLTVPNRTTFTFQFLTEQVGLSIDGDVINYSLASQAKKVGGLHEITEITTTSFTYDAGVDLTGIVLVVGDNASVRGNIRIAGAADEDRVIASYTKSTQDSSFNNDTKFWLFLTYGAVFNSKSRNDISDALRAITNGSDPRQFLIEELNAIVIAPTVNSISGRKERDEIEDVKVALFKTILNFTAPNPYSTADFENYNYVFVSGTPLQYNSAYLAYEFTFQTQFDVSFADMFKEFPITPFRDILGMMDVDKKGQNEMTFNVDLDDDST